ncbi:MAG: hypothetical protein UY15_C0028G0006 [Parcubacteria group bacterium GW2011_GWA2_47_9]|nr:MAG: hypothetical protein UY15_C0028G0006 [Parcubacteria group bacterium GW2011_GWA2_47_9]
MLLFFKCANCGTMLGWLVFIFSVPPLKCFNCGGQLAMCQKEKSDGTPEALGTVS